MNTNANEVNGGKGAVAPTSDDAIRLWEDRGKYASTATHSSNFGTIVAWFIVFEVVRSIDKTEIREEPLGRDLH